MTKRFKVLSAFASTLVLLALLVNSTASPQPVLAQATSAPTTAAPGTMVATMAGTALEPIPALFDGKRALQHVAAQVNFGYRPTGSDAIIKTGDYIIKTLKDAGWKVTEQPFVVNVKDSQIKARNIIASMGTGPLIVIGAHYDTRLIANNDPDPAKQAQPVLGANDGASGVGVLLELARVLSKGYQFTHEIRLVFFDAEDNGNVPGWSDWSLGASYYADNLEVRPEYAIIIDMIGDSDLNIYYEANSMESDPDLVKGVWDVAQQLGYGQSFVRESKYNLSDDHLPFIRKGIQAIDIIDFDYPYWHTVSDTLDKVSAASLEKVGTTLQVYLEHSAAIKVTQ